MAKITDYTCFWDGKLLLTDAFGNNAAFACPECEHPVLLATGDVAKRGLDSSKPSECRKCGKKYKINAIDNKEEKINIVYAD